MEKFKKVLILGANSDIGKNIAHQLSKKKYKLTLISRNIDEIKFFLDRLNINTKEIEFICMDLKEIDKFQLYYDNLKSKHDIVISAIGEFSKDTDSHKMNLIDQMINSNYIYPAKCLEVISNIFLRENSPKEKIILGISSVAGDRGRATNFHYGAAKSAFTVFLSGLRQKLSKSKITIITVSLGFVDTKMTKDEKISNLLNTKPEIVAKKIIICIEKSKLIYIPLQWRIIMTIIKLIPENIFKKLNF
ncbi:SDR family NAD(P)-dependent oxidoreductase [Candidatus Pelagibacter sp.]|nr:SDR family NAD(P)-dependent oxidoreductase [Candidatus Pelagibacter sp.]